MPDERLWGFAQRVREYGDGRASAPVSSRGYLPHSGPKPVLRVPGRKRFAVLRRSKFRRSCGVTTIVRDVAPLFRVSAAPISSLRVSCLPRNPIPSFVFCRTRPLPRLVRDLEGVVDALKRVTDKLRGENDRLRRMAGDGGGRAEAERSAREAKKKAVSYFGSSTNQIKPHPRFPRHVL